MVHRLLYSRFARLIRLLRKEKQEAVKEKFIVAAFTAFQLGAGGDNKTFGDYLVHLGLSEKQPQKVGPQEEDDTLALARIGIKVKKVKKK